MRFWSALEKCAYNGHVCMRRKVWHPFEYVKSVETYLGRELLHHRMTDIIHSHDEWYKPSQEDMYAIDWEVTDGDLRDLR